MSWPPFNNEYFDQAYVNAAQRIFMTHSTHYPWEGIVNGVRVQGRVMRAVAGNTFRGFHKIDKTLLGAAAVFKEYFNMNCNTLVEALNSVQNTADLDKLCDEISEKIAGQLTNICAEHLNSYNKIRKPVDLYVEHLVAMSCEMATKRPHLMPLLRLPIDSQIIQCKHLFCGAELKANALSRGSSFSDVKSKDSYDNIQCLIAKKAVIVTQQYQTPFYPIYFDLIWGNRRDHAMRGMSSNKNLFEIS